MVLQALLLVASGCLLVLLLLVLFEPGLPYRIVSRGGVLANQLLPVLGTLVDSEVRCAKTAEVYSQGDAFYDAELAAISGARTSVHVEAFIFHASDIGDRFLSALAQCATRGVTVRVIVDAIGSFPTSNAYFDRLRHAGGQVAWYQPIRWYTLKRFNNRSHRNVMVIDGVVGFIGGAGISAHWTTPQQGLPAWRDTVVRVTGSVVAGLQSTFLENWLEATGEILAGKDSFPNDAEPARGVPALVVTGTPSPARASRARVLFQVLLASAAQRIEITSPYFLPDRSARRELIAAAARKVNVRVIVPGRHNNHPITRWASRRLYGELLRAGVEIFEYQPGMIHAKVLAIDGCWSVVGSTNFDSRSFEINDEANLAIFDTDLAARLARDFATDLRRSHGVTIAEWERRTLFERVVGACCSVLQRQE